MLVIYKTNDETVAVTNQTLSMKKTYFECFYWTKPVFIIRKIANLYNGTIPKYASN